MQPGLVRRTSHSGHSQAPGHGRGRRRTWARLHSSPALEAMDQMMMMEPPRKATLRLAECQHRGSPAEPLRQRVAGWRQLRLLELAAVAKTEVLGGSHGTGLGRGTDTVAHLMDQAGLGGRHGDARQAQGHRLEAGAVAAAVAEVARLTVPVGTTGGGRSHHGQTLRTTEVVACHHEAAQGHVHGTGAVTGSVQPHLQGHPEVGTCGIGGRGRGHHRRHLRANFPAHHASLTIVTACQGHGRGP